MHKNIILLLYQYRLLIHTYVPKNAIVSKDAVFFFLYSEAAIYTKNLLFSHLFFLVNKTGESIE